MAQTAHSFSEWMVWVTRTDSAQHGSLDALKAAGFTPLSAPLLRLKAASTPDKAPPDMAALALTSPNGARAFAALTDRRDWQIFAVGEATANMAERLGFVDVSCAYGTVDDLAALIIKSKPDQIVHLSGVHIAGDLVDALTQAGIKAQRTIIYATHPVETLPQAAQQALSCLEADSSPQAVLLYSPKGALRFVSLMQEAYSFALAHLHIVSLSPAIDAVLGDISFASRNIAVKPDEPSLIAALELAASKA